MAKPVVGVGAVVLRENAGAREVLLVRRRYPPFPGKWSIPGGHMEQGETIYETAVRELYEETGVRADPIGIIDVHELIVKSGAETRHYVIVDVLMRYLEGDPTPASDALEAAFHPLHQALQLDTTPATRKLLEKLARNETIDPFHPTTTICVDTHCT